MPEKNSIFCSKWIPCLSSASSQQVKVLSIPIKEFIFYVIILLTFYLALGFGDNTALIGDVSYPDINGYPINDHQNFSRNEIYNSSHPYLTIATIPFKVNSMKVVDELLTSISSWLNLDKSVVVHLYDIKKGMGNMSNVLIDKLQEIWGKDRVFVRGKIIKRKKDLSERIPQIFETVEKNAISPLVAYINNDIILDPEFFKYLQTTAVFFSKYNNWSFHVARTNLNDSCRSKITYSTILSKDWPTTFETLKNQCITSTQVYGYDVFLWNRIPNTGISMKKGKIPGFFIGKPFFEYSVITAVRSQGWLITAFPKLLSFHIEHPERMRMSIFKNTSDYNYTLKLHLKSHDMSVRNVDLNLRINLSHVTLYHKKQNILPGDNFTTFPVQHYMKCPLLPFDKRFFAPLKLY